MRSDQTRHVETGEGATFTRLSEVEYGPIQTYVVENETRTVRKEFKVPLRYRVLLLPAAGYFRKEMTLLPRKWRKSYDDIVVRFDR